MKWVKGLLALGCLGAALGVGLFYAVYQHVHSPLSLTQDHRFRVENGERMRTILRRLTDEKALSRPDWVYAYARLTDQATALTGTYAIRPGMTPKDVVDTIHEGRVLTESFTVAEGLNRWQVRDLLARAEWMSADDFDHWCDDAAFLQSQQIPGPTCEGYLYPDTYSFARGVSAKSIFETLFATFHRNYLDVTERLGTGPLGFPMRKFVTLSSIIEKETGAPEERPRIACLFYNRLTDKKEKWRLQTDPTVIYAATLEDPNFDGNLKTWHLRELKNPYNTYTNFGLPPGPIANPGRSAFEAVAKPAVCEDYFFVSKNNGTHVFCPTLACHNAAVKKWQIDYFKKN